jgi:hypothetical protein
MLSIVIPESDITTLRQLSSVGKDAIEQLCSALEHAPASLNPNKLTNRVASEVSLLSQDDIDGILSVIISLNRFQVTYGGETSEVIDAVLRAIEVDNPLDEQLKQTISSHLATLLGVRRFNLWTKAHEVLHENERNFTSARVITDIRPIFGENVNEPPNGAVVVHTLKIEFAHGRSPHRHFYVTLDDTDLDKLIEQLKRAKTKAETLKTNFIAADIIPFDAESGE